MHPARILFCFLAFLLLAAPPTDAQTIQDMIDAAAPGDTITLAAMTYTGAGNRDLDFGGKDLVLRGQGPGLTIINAQWDTRVFLFQNGETSASVIQDIGIHNGAATDTSPFAIRGGAVYVHNASPVFRNCDFQNSFALNFVTATVQASAGQGGAVFVNGGSPRFEGCLFEDQVAAGYATGQQIDSGVGGVACVLAGSIEFSDCTFRANGVIAANNNTGNSDRNAQGGVLFLYPGTTGTFVDCLLEDNGTQPTSTAPENGDGGAIASYGTLALTNTVITGSFGARGGALFLEGGVTTIEGGSISASTADLFGGGIAITAGTLRADSLTVAGNAAGTSGGGIGSIGAGSVRLDRSLLLDNESLEGGGYLGASSGTDTLVACEVRGNRVPLGPTGGIELWGSDALLEECLITGNQSLSEGGGVFWRTGSSGSMVRCTVSGNLGNTSVQLDGSVDLDRCILWGNAGLGQEIVIGAAGFVTTTCSLYDPAALLATGTFLSGGDDFLADPLFCDPRGFLLAPTNTGDYTLDGNSPALASQTPCGQTVGAKGVGCGQVGIPEGGVGPGAILHAASPNPFRASTRIAFDLPAAGPVRLEVFDLAGRSVRVLENGTRPAGRHGVTWDGRTDHGTAAATGIYFVKLTAGGTAFTGKLALRR